MFHAEEYMDKLLNALMSRFGDRLTYVGLQGSYMRGEANEKSDIDPMVVINDLCVSDLDVYKSIISELECPEKSCGFICGKEDLLCWNPLEICHLLYTTKDCFGQLSELVPDYSDTDVRNFVKLSVDNLYHEITHRYIHTSEAKNVARITDSYKCVFFILQNVHYLETGSFVIKKVDLVKQLTSADAEILKTAIALEHGESYEFSSLYSRLFNWCKGIIHRI